jgi:hypothetical protein
MCGYRDTHSTITPSITNILGTATTTTTSTSTEYIGVYSAIAISIYINIVHK